MASETEAKHRLMLVAGLGLGAAAMYLLDPARGKARRALLRDKAARAIRLTECSAEVASRDLQNRIAGIVADAWSTFRAEQVSDEVLVDRVRARVGHVAGRPHGLDVKVHDGLVTLGGEVVGAEIKDLVKAAASVHGVKAVQVRELVLHKRPEEALHSLCGGIPRWSPSTRLLVGAAGGLLTLYGSRRRGPLGLIAGAAGLSILGRSITNTGLAELIGLEPKSIRIQKTINIDAPVSEVFEFWANPENFPRVMSHVQEVRKIGENRYHWKMTSPPGLSIEWEGSITRIIPNELVAWQSLPGSLVANSGVARLDPNYDASTRLHIQMSYEPPAGVLGHAIAELFGAGPKSVLDEEFARLKTLFEHGRTKVHGHTVTHEDVLRPSQPELLSTTA